LSRIKQINNIRASYPILNIKLKKFRWKIWRIWGKARKIEIKKNLILIKVGLSHRFFLQSFTYVNILKNRNLLLCLEFCKSLNLKFLRFKVFNILGLIKENGFLIVKKGKKKAFFV